MDATFSVLFLQDELASTIEHAVKAAVDTVLCEITKVVGSKFTELQMEIAGKERENESLKLRLEISERQLKAVRGCVNGADADIRQPGIFQDPKESCSFPESEAQERSEIQEEESFDQEWCVCQMHITELTYVKDEEVPQQECVPIKEERPSENSVCTLEEANQLGSNLCDDPPSELGFSDRRMQSTECNSSTEDLAATPSNVATRSTKRKSRVEETEAMATSSHPQVENQAVEEMKEATNGAEKEEETLEMEVSDTEEEIRQGQEVATASAPLRQSSRVQRCKLEFVEWFIEEFEPDDETPDLEVTGEAGEQEEARAHSVVAGQESVPVAGRAELEVPQSPLSWLCKYVKYRYSFIVDSQMQEGASDPSDPSETQEERHALETEPGTEEREAGTQRALAGQESVPVAGGAHYSLSCLCKLIIYGDSLVVDFSDPSQAELVDAIAAVQFLKDEFEVDLVCVVKCLLENSGDFQATRHYLHTGRRVDGRPLWTRHEALILKYGEGHFSVPDLQRD